MSESLSRQGTKKTAQYHLFECVRPEFLGMFYCLYKDHAVSAAATAATFAHEMGHNFGMSHDTDGESSFMTMNLLFLKV